jgi:hypothetical protein
LPQKAGVVEEHLIGMKIGKWQIKEWIHF